MTGPQLGAYWHYHVGGDRIICDIQDAMLRIQAIEVGNWRDVYR